MKFALSIIAVALLAAAAQAGNTLPVNSPVKMSGVDIVCTGVGSHEDDRRWASFPVRVEFTNRRHQYVSDADVVLAKADGTTLAKFHCSETWVLFRLPPGTYEVTGVIAPGPGGSVSKEFSPPAKGQKQVVLIFTSHAAD